MNRRPMFGEEYRKFGRFLIVGAVNTALMYGLYLGLLRLGWHYAIALTADYACGILLGYLLNRYWTFKLQGRPRYGLLKYALGYAGVYTLNLAFLTSVVEWLHIGEGIAQIPAIGTATVVSYAWHRLWTFRLT